MQNEDDIYKLRAAVYCRFSKFQSIDLVKLHVLKDTGFNKSDVLRRDYDGNSQVEWLIEKMIGELLINGKIEV